MKHRFEHLDGLRGLAALNVMFGHALLAFDFALYTGDPLQSHGAWDITVSALPLLLPIAGQNFSVCIFLVMSGFVLAHAFGRSSLGAPALAAKRFTRLGLPIFAATLFAWALLAAGAVCNHAAAALTRSAWLDLQMTHGANLRDALAEGTFGALLGAWRYADTYDSSLWTMSVEFAGSLLLIVAFTLRRRFGQSRFLPAAGLAGLGAALYPTYVSLVVLGAALSMLDLRRFRLPKLFAPGAAALALLIGTVPYSALRGRFWDALVALAPAHGLALPWDRFGAAAARMDGPSAWHGLAALLLLAAVETSPSLRRRLAAPRLGFLGLVSFPLYVVHVPVLLSVGCGMLLLATAAGLPYAAAAAVALLCYAATALGLATAAVAIIERPSIRAADRVARFIDGLLTRSLSHPFARPLPPKPAA